MNTTATKSKPYAQGTKVDPLKTLMDIRSLLQRAGATQFMTYGDERREGIGFAREGIAYRVVVGLPETEQEAKTFASSRKGTAGHGTYMEAERARRMRSLFAVVKARLVSIEDGIETFEEAFFGDAITETGQTVKERMVPQIRQAAIAGRYPSALPMPGDRT